MKNENIIPGYHGIMDLDITNMEPRYIKQAIEITMQLRGEAKDRQVKNAKIGVTHNVGGSGATAAVHVFKKVE